MDTFPICLFSVCSWTWSCVPAGASAAPNTPTASVKAVIQMDFMIDVFLNVFAWKYVSDSGSRRGFTTFQEPKQQAEMYVRDVMYIYLFLESFLYIYIYNTGELFGSSRLRGHRLSVIMPSCRPDARPRKAT